MKKTILIVMVLCLVVLPANGEIALKLGGLFSGPFSIDNSVYSPVWSDDAGIVSFLERNNSSFTTKGGIGFNAGLSFFMNYKMGFGVTVATLKTKANISNVYNWNFTWWNGASFDIDPKTWNSESDINALPVSFNIIFRLVSKENMKVNLFLGPTLFFVSPDLTGNGGYADGPVEFENNYYVDWYDVPLEIKGAKTLFGGNGGFEFEYFFSESMALFFNGGYYFGGSLEDNWKVKTGKYTGEFGNLVGTINSPDILEGYKVKIKISTYFFGFGIKVYL